MTAITNGRDVLATMVYKMSLENLYGVRAGNIDLFAEYNRYMMIRVLEWNTGYLTAAEVRCLEGKIQRPARNCNC